jgi:hypothetical protein
LPKYGKISTTDIQSNHVPNINDTILWKIFIHFEYRYPQRYDVACKVIIAVWWFALIPNRGERYGKAVASSGEEHLL